ncbi:response regulator [Methylorubrum sp. SB2]|uniref:response regulator n=1 Tax=Methylorubrum subtropicum TaxID=3138812 RepID=UPI00313D4204
MDQVSVAPGPIALVVEDEPLIMMETSDLLADRGFVPIEANNAADALRQLAAHPNVVLMVTDVQMPGRMQGFELAHEAHRLYPSLAIIVCSGQRTPAAGDIPKIAHFIDKPLSAAVLAKSLSGFKLVA